MYSRKGIQWEELKAGCGQLVNLKIWDGNRPLTVRIDQNALREETARRMEMM
jgi:hypothetical protein